MQIGMIGLGRMGGNMARRLTKGGHQSVVFDRNWENVNARGEADYQDRLLSAMRFGFGGHLEKAAKRL